MKTLRGDLLRLALDGVFDVIVHGCNCHCAMGAGIAKSIKREFPEAYAADRATPKGDRAKLGMVSHATVVRNDRPLTIVNGYTQYDWRGSGVLVDYDAIHSVMSRVKTLFGGRRIGYPKIGAGLARGDWERIRLLIDAALDGEDHCLVEFDG